MRLLLDTHVLLWYSSADPRLSINAKSAITDPGNQLLFSTASVWEIAIKISLGRLTLDDGFQAYFDRQFRINRIELLELGLEHAAALTNLPNHHRDPFDRMLACQCLTDDLDLISVDRVFDAYAVRRYW